MHCLHDVSGCTADGLDSNALLCICLCFAESGLSPNVSAALAAAHAAIAACYDDSSSTLSSVPSGSVSPERHASLTSPPPHSVAAEALLFIPASGVKPSTTALPNLHTAAVQTSPMRSSISLHAPMGNQLHGENASRLGIGRHSVQGGNMQAALAADMLCTQHGHLGHAHALTGDSKAAGGGAHNRNLPNVEHEQMMSAAHEGNTVSARGASASATHGVAAAPISSAAVGYDTTPGACTADSVQAPKLAADIMAGAVRVSPISWHRNDLSVISADSSYADSAAPTPHGVSAPRLLGGLGGNASGTAQDVHNE